ncbi:uncharacterized protein K444DRAFT_72060 [Hyaloscypha bicolor E]|uniref:Mid2 domain-containing protein n=1 Tax=Hyaloscypha bicolor E TaxID=1095630 RepID=A0A2J6SZ81_9HELO|nr:uncharacterized protein K444DRAFT_72060 [Hyaloscypha bicolor E]PMD56091.1 hypothetical protein K444DRAFT_72060 [Hyaloscypha bicolor E]
MLHSKAYLSVAVLLAHIARATLNTNCFRMSDGRITENVGAIPCGVVTADSPNVPCCNAGSFCLADSICLNPGTPNSGFSGYYTGGCTDLTYDDQSCNPYCRSVPRADIVYNNGTKLWSCCGTESDNTTVNCNDPTTIIFSDPAPTALSTTFSVGSTAGTSIPSSTSSVTTTSISSSSATTPSGSPSQTGTGSPQPSSGLSTGAKAGIGVGAAIIGIAVLVGVFVLYRRRKRSSMQPPSYNRKTAPAELGAVPEAKRAELNTERPIQELA